MQSKNQFVIMQYLNKAKSFGCGLAICGCNAGIFLV